MHRRASLLQVLGFFASVGLLSACATFSADHAWHALPTRSCLVAFAPSLDPLPSPWNRWTTSRVPGQRYVHVLGYEEGTVWLASSHLDTQESASVKVDSALTFELATWQAGHWTSKTASRTLTRSSTVSLSPGASLQTSPLTNARLEAQRRNLTQAAQQACALSLIPPV